MKSISSYLKLIILFILLVISYSSTTIAEVDEDYMHHAFCVYAKSGDYYEVWGGDSGGGTGFYNIDKNNMELLGKAPQGGTLLIDQVKNYYYIAVPKYSHVEVDAIALGGKGYLYDPGELNGECILKIGNSCNHNNIYGPRDGKYTLFNFSSIGWSSGGEYQSFLKINMAGFDDYNFPELEVLAGVHVSGSFDIYSITESMIYLPGYSSDDIGYNPESVIDEPWISLIDSESASCTIDVPEDTHQLLISNPSNDDFIFIDAIEFFDNNGDRISYFPSNWNSGNTGMHTNFYSVPDDYAGYISPGGYIMLSLDGEQMGADGIPIPIDTVKSVKINIKNSVEFESIEKYPGFYYGDSYHPYVETVFDENGKKLKLNFYNIEKELFQYCVYNYDNNNYKISNTYYDSNDNLLYENYTGNIWCDNLKNGILTGLYANIFVDDSCSINDVFADNVTINVENEEEIKTYQMNDIGNNCWTEIVTMSDFSNKDGVYTITAFGSNNQNPSYYIGSYSFEFVNDNVPPKISYINFDPKDQFNRIYGMIDFLEEYDDNIESVKFGLSHETEDMTKTIMYAGSKSLGAGTSWDTIISFDNLTFTDGKFNYLCIVKDAAENYTYGIIPSSISGNDISSDGVIFSLMGINESGTYKNNCNLELLIRHLSSYVNKPQFQNFETNIYVDDILYFSEYSSLWWSDSEKQFNFDYSLPGIHQLTITVKYTDYETYIIQYPFEIVTDTGSLMIEEAVRIGNRYCKEVDNFMDIDTFYNFNQDYTIDILDIINVTKHIK
jgi:hypothetical protein